MKKFLLIPLLLLAGCDDIPQSTYVGDITYKEYSGKTIQAIVGSSKDTEVTIVFSDGSSLQFYTYTSSIQVKK